MSFPNGLKPADFLIEEVVRDAYLSAKKEMIRDIYPKRGLYVFSYIDLGSVRERTEDKKGKRKSIFSIGRSVAEQRIIPERADNVFVSIDTSTTNQKQLKESIKICHSPPYIEFMAFYASETL